MKWSKVGSVVYDAAAADEAFEMGKMLAFV
jgi:hypothetical protein